MLFGRRNMIKSKIQRYLLKIMIGYFMQRYMYFSKFHDFLIKNQKKTSPFATLNFTCCSVSFNSLLLIAASTTLLL